LRSVFTRLLKVLWILNLIFASGIILICILMMLLDGIDTYLEGLPIKLFISICLGLMLMVVQYILLGSFNPRRLINRESRY
jgi:hypothetical protein